MANKEHLQILRQGIENWNRWRQENPEIEPDLALANLSESELEGADFNKTNLRGANLSRARLGHAEFYEADLEEADLSGADLEEADFTSALLSQANLSRAFLLSAVFEAATLIKANFSEAKLVNAMFFGANCGGANFTAAELIEVKLINADLSGADLRGANLKHANLIGTNLERANITNCYIYGMNAWDVKLEGAIQFNLNISNYDEPTITVDDLEVAQFVHLILNNRKIRNVIDNITSKAVLILGRFSPERRIILDALWTELRTHGYLPILFDFDKPTSRNLTETVSTLAHLARFVIADITDAKSIPQELQRIVPNLPSLPVQPILLSSEYEYAMFRDFTDYPWVLAPYRYESVAELLGSLEEKVIRPAAAKAKEIEERRLAFERMYE